ncbi:MAG: oligosaccharide flippase family protein, partial [bacterium]
MLKRISNVFLILVMTVGFGFFKNILMARELSKSDFGLFNLIMTLVGLIYPLAMLGQQNTLVRFFSKYTPDEYDWPSFIQRLLLLVLPVSIGFTAIASLFYDFSRTALFFLPVVILSSVIADLYTYILRAIGRYESSILLHRSIRIAFPVALLGLIYADAFSLEMTFYLFGALYILHSVVIIT